MSAGNDAARTVVERDYRPGTLFPSLVPSLLAALTTWVTLLAWTPFAEKPAGFVVPLFGACLLVAVSGMALRSARLPALVVVLVQSLLVLLWLQHRLAGGAALGGLVPTPDSVRAMATAVHTAGVVSQTYSAPVPASAPEFYPLLILLGSFSAVLVDLLAVGLRRAPLAGLPLLAVYTAPLSILDGGVSWLKFAVAALCFLFLIASGEEQRLTHWGRQLTPRRGVFDAQSGVFGGQAVWSSARRIGFTATALAVVAPLLLPTVSATLFGGGGRHRGGEGNSVSISNPMVDLRRDLTRGADVDLVTVSTTDPDPSYLRISVLNTFDGTAWRPSGRDIPLKQRATGKLPKPPGLYLDVPSRSYASTVRVSRAFESRWLPTPYPVTSVTAGGDWRYDRSTLDFISAADGQTTAGMSYTLRSLVLSPTASELADATPAPLSVFTPNTALPRGLPDYVRRLADNVVKGKASKFEQAVALQDFFRQNGGFRYSTARSAGNGTNQLLSFLGTGKGSRVGYCEQFAAAMALMGRTLSIPSRVAVGFLQPEKTGPDTWVYSTHDLHAWPEMYFGGVGWVRFEPTPQGRAGGVPAYTTQQVAPDQAPSANSAPSAAASATSRNKAVDPQVAAGKSATGSSVDTGAVLGWLGGALLVVLLVATPRALRSLVRRRRWAAAAGPGDWAEAAWSEIRDTATDLRTVWDDRVTLRTAALRLAATFGRPGDPGGRSGAAAGSGRSGAAAGIGRSGAAAGIGRSGTAADPEAAAALDRLVRLLERARYARDLPSEATTLEQVLADLDSCVAAMRAGAGRRRRVLAAWLPVSLLTSVGTRRRLGRRPPVIGEQGVDRAVRSSA
jgi:transglutaminase-like putative cysteine protease